jgi:acetyl esterase
MLSKRLLLVGAAGAAIGLAGCAVHSAASSRQHEATSEPAVHIYRSVGEESLRAFVFSPPQPARAPVPAVLFFHGGGWSTGSAEWSFATAQRFARLGVVAIAIDYRLAKGETTPIEALDDTCSAFRWVRRNARELRIDPRRVGGYGVSAGGQLLAAAATRGCGSREGIYSNGGPDALLLWSPALNVAGDRWFAKLLQGRDSAEKYSPLQNVPARLAPVGIVQGAEDTLTPLRDAQRFCELAVANGNRCELNVYPSLGHLLTRNLQNQEDDYDPDPEAREDAFTKLERFLRELWLAAG